MVDARHYRQGDVLLIAVRAIPPRSTPVAPDQGRIVLAYGEVTGHAHAFGSERVRYFREDESGRGYVQIAGTEPVALTHEEHDPIFVEPGMYEVRRQREYRPRAQPRLIAD